jgi:ankyrin repeat protein
MLPLHFAAAKGHACITKQLIEARCTVDLETMNGATPLFIAALYGHVAVTCS